MKFAGQTVFITGASSGIGRALALAFAGQGARVGVTARRAEPLNALLEEIRALGGTADLIIADATDREATNQALRALSTRLGACDILVANAGTGASNTSTDLNVAGAERVIRTNLLGPMYAIEAVLPDMLARGSGHLVGVSSVVAVKGLPTAAAYCASKAGLNVYLESLRISLRSRKIAVTTVLPGFVRTEMTAKNPRMFWVLEPEEFARRLVRALARRPKMVAIPRRMHWLMGLTRWLPDRLTARMVPEETAERNL